MSTSALFGAAAAYAAMHHGVVPSASAARLGLSRQNLRSLVARGVLVGPRSGVYVVAGSPPTWRRAVAVAVLGGGPGWMASHRSAAVLHGIEGLVADGVEVLAPNGARRRIEGVVVRQSRTVAGSDCTVIDGIPVTSVARTMVDLASVLDESSLQRAFDDVIRRGASRRWLRETALRSSRGRSGPSRLLALLDALGDNVAPESWFERLLEASLASPLLDGLVRQHEIRSPDGRLVARCDLALPPLRLAFEGHSRRHHDSTWARRYDEGRDIAAAKLGWEIVYLGFAATRSPASVRRDMEEVAMRRARDLARAA